jgi:acetyl esterase/lipase
MMAEANSTDLTAIDPSLRTVARFLPCRRGSYARHLHLTRTRDALLWRLIALRHVDVVRVSPTASVRVYRPSSPAGVMPGVLWIHGGGYVAGAAAMDDRLARETARQIGALVASVEYRLAPEHPYPAALDDCFAALQWLVTRGDVDQRRIVVVGISAGGGLAAALNLRWRDAGLIDLAGQVLVYPMLDDRTVQRSIATGARGWPPEDNAFGWRSYLGREPGDEGVSFYAAPARCDDLSGLPPTWIGVGTADLFHDENVDYARRLRDAGVPTHLEVVAGAFHGFDRAGALTSIARRFTANRLAATRQFLTDGEPLFNVDE